MTSLAACYVVFYTWGAVSNTLFFVGFFFSKIRVGNGAFSDVFYEKCNISGEQNIRNYALYQSPVYTHVACNLLAIGRAFYWLRWLATEVLTC